MRYAHVGRVTRSPLEKRAGYTNRIESNDRRCAYLIRARFTYYSLLGAVVGRKMKIGR